MKPSSIQKRRAYQLGPASSGGRSVRMIQGSSCSTYQTASRVQRRFAVGVLKAVPRPIQARIGTGNEVLCGQPAAVLGAEADVLPIPHVGMPAPRSGRGQALSAYLSPQLGTGDAPVAEHDDGHFPGNRRGQFPEQFHRGIHPGAALGGPVDAPGHGNGATPVDHADDDGGGLVAFERGINGQSLPRTGYGGQATGTPPSHDPPEQWGEAEAYVQFGLAGTSPVAAVVEPLPEILAEVVPSAPGREGGGHGVLAGAAGENGPADPQSPAPYSIRGPGRSTVVGRGEVDAFQ